MSKNKINYESDFKLYERNLNGDITTPFRFVYTTYGDEKYECSFLDGVYNNCIRMEDGTLMVVFENHGLKPSELKVKRYYYLSDSDFHDGICNLVTIEHTGIVLVNGKTDYTEAVTEPAPIWTKLTYDDLTEKDKEDLVKHIDLSSLHGLVKTTDVVDNLTSTSTVFPLSANQGKILNDKITNAENKITNIENTISNLGGSANFILPDYTQWGNIDSTNITTILGPSNDFANAINNNSKFICNGQEVKVITKLDTDNVTISTLIYDEFSKGYVPGYLICTHQLTVSYTSTAYVTNPVSYKALKNVPNIYLEYELSGNPPTSTEAIKTVVNQALGMTEHRNHITTGNLTIGIKLSSSIPFYVYFDYGNFCTCRILKYPDMYNAILESGSTLTVSSVT